MAILIEPTAEQWEIYNRIRKAQLICEAENAVLEFFGFEPSSEDLSHKEFEEKNGYTIADAINPRSEHYVLPSLVSEFEEEMSSEMSAKTCWDYVVEKILFS